MFFIIKYVRQWVIENSGRFLETDLVFSEVRPCLIVIPFELRIQTPDITLSVMLYASLVNSVPYPKCRSHAT